MTLDYVLLGKAIKYYKSLGYKEVELPWTASKEAIEATLPPQGLPISSDIGMLVGSAEQSFLDRIVMRQQEGGRFLGKYQATTPCFRNEIEDSLHKKYFMKTELFNNETVTGEELQKMIAHALNFFDSLNLDVDFMVDPTGDHMFDILEEQTGIEVGSYGIRHHEKFGSWIYGTGIALPRLDSAIISSIRVTIERSK